ncbi:Rne/Rng family ribonuclease [Aestuariibius insulae]|uniref:Rne/Rng family ribonuclease n=1 Tax=Aestuariibius insulae TaxID=2058287 RepID=UPI00345E5C9E
MPKKMLIDATHAEETRVVVVDGNKLEEFDFESQQKRQLAGNIYLAKVTRVEPSLQAAFIEYGGNRHGFLAFSEIHPDYYQIPVADREALIAEERAYAESQREEEEEKPKPKRRRRSRTKAAETKADDAVTTEDIHGMETFEEPDPDKVNEPLELTMPPEGFVPIKIESREESEAAAESAKAEETSENQEATTEEPSENGSPAEAREEITQPPSEEDAEDDDIESVADEDDSEDIRPVRKARPKRYKIQEVVKVRQILLVQVVKEERGNKGAALTTYLSLAGRYCVLMPNTARGGGISRKITNAADRKKLKEIANEIEVPDGAGLIVRTAGAKRTKSEIKRDYEYLQRLWEQIRELTLKSIAPAKIYEEGNLIKRSIRDLYNRDIDEIHVEGEEGYRTAKDFMKMIMPSHAKNVKRYGDGLPLFARYQVETTLAAMFNPTVQLPSGGYIVIGVTEALVAIDVNSGRATKEGSIEQTALKTNLEAAEEVARQLRLRDLAGLIVIDFIDMDERRNNTAVEKRLKDKLKTDRARIQVGRISGFGLLEMSRQRLRPGMLEATTQPCPHCHGTGLLRSDDSTALAILRQLEEEGVRGKCKEVLVKAPVSIANYLINEKRENIAQIEGRFGLSVRIEGDPSIISPDFQLEKFKTATRVVAEAPVNFVSGDASLMSDLEEEPEVEQDEEEQVAETAETSDEEERPKKRRRRRRRRRGNGNADGPSSEHQQDGAAEEQAPADADAEAETAMEAQEASPATDAEDAPAGEETPEEKPKRRRRTRKPKADKVEADVAPEASEAPKEPEPVAVSEEPATIQDATPQEVVEAVDEVKPEPVAEEATAEPPKRRRTRVSKAKPAPEPAPEPVTADASAEADAADKPKRRGWWSLGR